MFPNSRYDHVAEVVHAPRKPSPSDAEQVDDEMQQVMGPFVSTFAQEFAQKWPHLDPEVVLLKFLCDRQNIEPPETSILRTARPKSSNARSRRYEEASAKQGGSEESEKVPTVKLPPSQPSSSESQGARACASGSGPPPPPPGAEPSGPSALDAEVQRMQSPSPEFELQGASGNNSRPPSNLSFYKGSRPNSSLANPRPESAVSTRFADTPLDDAGRRTATPNDDDEESSRIVSREALDKMQWHDAAFERQQSRELQIADKTHHGHFIDFALPTPRIDDCPDTPYIVRHAACLRDRLEARREDSFAALGKTGLKTLGHAQALAEKDFMDQESRKADTTRDLAGFAARIATVRQGLRGEFISKVPLLSLDVVTKEEQFWLLGKLKPGNYCQGDAVFVEGETGDKLFIVEGGTCMVTKDEKGEKKTLCHITAGDSFGDMAVMYDMPRSATVTAATSVKLLSLSRDDIFSTVGPESLDKMKAMTRMQLLLTTPALAAQSLKDKLLLLKHMRTDVIRAGRELMREGWRSGAANRRVYIIERGSCSQERAGIPASSEVLAAGMNFGNTEFAFGCPQQSTVVATTEVSVISIGYDEIWEVLGREAEVALQVMQRSMRLRLLRDAHPQLRWQDERTLGSVLDAGTFRRFDAWQPIVRKDEAVTHMLMLEQGICIEHDEDLLTLMDSTVESAKSTEHSRPGDTFNTSHPGDQKGAVAPFTVVAICECSVFYLPIEVLSGLPELSVESESTGFERGVSGYSTMSSSYSPV